jgi:dTDP-4-dehydrorhamnose 3,5-epimerase
MIDGVKIKKLKFICDDRGRLIELLRSDWPEFIKFGQIYMTTAKKDIVKAWHYHKKQTDNFLCYMRSVKVVLYDARPESPTFKNIEEILCGKDNPVLIQIPPRVYHGFMGIEPDESIVFNACTELYNYKEPDEYRVPFNDSQIAYDWGIGAIQG